MTLYSISQRCAAFCYFKIHFKRAVHFRGEDPTPHTPAVCDTTVRELSTCDLGEIDSREAMNIGIML
jgi:hypothetical protein